MASPGKLSIRKKIVLALSLLGALPGVLTLGVAVWLEAGLSRAEIKRGGVAMANVIADLSVADLTKHDAAASGRTLRLLKYYSDVECAFVYDSNGHLFSSYEKAGCFAPSPEPASASFKDHSLHVFHPVEDQNGVYGTVYVRTSAAVRGDRLRHYLIIFGLFAVCSVIIILLLALKMDDMISKPLSNLTRATQQITEERDYSVRVKTQSTDELGVLYRRFNAMMNQIERRKEERDKAEGSLLESEDRYRTLVESSPEGILLEKNSEIVYANHSALRLTGYESLEDLHGIAPAALFTEVPGDFSNGIPLEIQLLRKDGVRLDAELTCVKTVHQGPAVQYLFRDVTESKNLRREKQRMEHLAALGEFSAMLAHEIRNSIGSIALNVRTLSERLTVPDVLRKNLENLDSGVLRIQELIRAVLAFARPETPNLQPVKISMLIESGIHLILHELEKKQVTIDRQYDSQDPEVHVDTHQISQVFVNLFLNAGQAMDGGGTIEVKTSRESDCVLVQVADSGKGIPAENLDKIFDPFFTTTPLGVGLGLAFVSRILDQHQARIQVESQVGSGTVFSIRFPVKD